MKQYLILILSLIICSSVQGTEAFYFNQAGHIQVPQEQRSYSSLSLEENSRMGTLLSVARRSPLADKELFKSFGEKLSHYKREKQFSSNRANKALKELDQVFKALIGHVDDLQVIEPEIFTPLKDSRAHNINWGTTENLPSYCKNYPELGRSEIDEYYSGMGVDNNEVIFQGCREDKNLNITLSELIENIGEVTANNYKDDSRLVRDHLMEMIAQKIVENRAQYEGIGEALPSLNDNSELKSCLSSKKNSYPNFSEKMDKLISPPKAKTSEQMINLKNGFDAFHVQNSLKADALLGAKDELERELKTKVDAFSSTTRKCARRGNRNPECSTYQSQIAALKSSYRDRTQKVDGELELIMKQTPTILQIENEPELSRFKIVNVKIKRSDLLEGYLKSSSKSKGLSKKLKANILSSVDNEQLSLLSADSTRDINDVIKEAQENSSLNSARSKAIKSYAASLESDLLNLCQNEGENLYHHPQIMSDLFNKVGNLGTSEKEGKLNVLKSQAGYCSLLRNAPPGEKDRGVAYFTGMGAIVAGVGVSFTGLGALPGAGLMVAGGSLVAADSLARYNEAQLIEQNALALNSSTWGSVRDTIEAKEAVVGATTDLVIDTASVALDATGAGLLIRSARIGRQALKNGEALVEGLAGEMHTTWPKGHRGAGGSEKFKEIPLKNGETPSAALARLEAEGFTGLKEEGGKLVQDINQEASKIVPELNLKLNGGPARDYVQAVNNRVISSTSDIENAASEIHEAWMKHNSWQKGDAPQLFKNYADLTASEKIKDLDVLEDALRLSDPEVLDSAAYRSYRKALEQESLSESAVRGVKESPEASEVTETGLVLHSSQIERQVPTSTLPSGSVTSGTATGRGRLAARSTERGLPATDNIIASSVDPNYKKLIDEALESSETPFLKGVTNSDELIKKITSSLDDAIESGEIYGHKLKTKEIESLRHEKDILEGVRNNPELLKELEKEGFDLKNYLQGTYQSDLGKLKPYIDLLTEKSPKSEVLLDFLKGRGPPEATSALKEVLEEMGHKGTLLSAELDNASIREVFKSNPILTGYLHEFPGMSEAVLAFQKGLISKADFKKQLSANLFHNGPSKGFWQLLEDAFIPGAAKGTKQQGNVASLFKGTVFDISQGTGSVVRPTYGKPHSFESFVGTFMDRMSQGTRGGYRKIDAELPGDPLDNIINLGGQTNIGGTRAQIAELKELAKNATHLTDSQRKIIERITDSGMKHLDQYLERSNQMLITAKDESGQVIRGGPFAPKKVPELSIKHNDNSGHIAHFVRNDDGSYLYQVRNGDEVISTKTLPAETAADDIRGIYDTFLARDEAQHGDPMRDLRF